MPKGNAIAAAVLAAAGKPARGSQGQSGPGALSPLVASYTAQYSVGRPYSPLPRPAPVFLEGAFGPGDPVTPMPISPPREDSGRPDPRRFQYPVFYNLPVGVPGSEGLKLAPFATLRAIADMYSVARSCVDKRKAEITGLEWDIVPTDEAEHSMADDDKARADWEQRRAKVVEFFSHPDSDRAKYPTFGTWLAALLEDRFVIDAVAVHLVPPRKKGAGPFGSDLASLDLLDGATIRPLLDVNGATPPPASPGYQQYLWGVPRVDLISVITGADSDELGGEPDAEFRADQLIYMREDPRAFTPYGFSCVEKALLPISIGLARQQYQNDYFTDGSIPGMFVTPGAEISTPQQVAQLQAALNAMAADIGAKHRIVVLPAGSDAKPLKPFPLADQFDEWIISQVTMPFGLTPMDLGVTPRVSAVQSPSESRELSQINSDKGSETRKEPVCASLKDVIFDRVIQVVFGQKDMEFSWGLTDRGKNRAAVIQEHIDLISNGLESIDEGRVDLGHTPWGLPETSVPLLITATGPVPLSSIGSEQPAAAGQPAALGQPVGQALTQPAAQGKPKPQSAIPQPTDEELTTPAHEAAEGLSSTPGKGGKQPPGNAEKQAAELEILARYLVKGRDPERFTVRFLPPESLTAAKAALPDGVDAAVSAAGRAAAARNRQDRRDTHIDAAAASVTGQLGRLVNAHRHHKLSLPQVIDAAVGVMATGYAAAMTAGSQDAAGDYPDTPPLDDTDDAAQTEAQGQRGFFLGLLQDIIGGLSIAQITARLGLFAATLRHAYNQAYGNTVMTAHPAYQIVWELGDNRDHCRLCVARDGKTFTLEDLPGWPGDGGFGPQKGPGGQPSVCLGGPNCHCSCTFIQGGQRLATGTNTQLPGATSYYAGQNALITAARQAAADARQAFTDSLPSGAGTRAMTRDQLAQALAATINDRIEAAGGYPGVSVEPQDIPAAIIAAMLPPGMEGAAGLSVPRLNIAQAVQLMFAGGILKTDQARAGLTAIVTAAVAAVAKDAADLADPTPVDAEHVYQQLLANYSPAGIAWVRSAKWIGPVSIPLDRVDTSSEESWSASEGGANAAHVSRFVHRIEGDGDVNPVIMVQPPGSDKVKVIDGHHRYEAYARLRRPVKAYVGFVDDDSARAPWALTHLYQVHSGGDPLNKRAMTDKDSVDYRPAQDPDRSCGTCVMFHPDGSCDLVRGQIAADATCDEWEAAPAAKAAAPAEDPSRVAFLLIRARNDEGKWRYLLHKRDDESWGLPGGKAHAGELPWDAAARESSEELGDLPGVRPAAVWTRPEDDHVVWTYLVNLPAMFTPSADGETSGETAGWGWFRRRDVPDLNLHPAMRETWDALDFDDPRLGGETPAAVKAELLPFEGGVEKYPGQPRDAHGRFAPGRMGGPEHQAYAASQGGAGGGGAGAGGSSSEGSSGGSKESSSGSGPAAGAEALAAVKKSEGEQSPEHRQTVADYVQYSAQMNNFLRDPAKNRPGRLSSETPESLTHKAFVLNRAIQAGSGLDRPVQVMRGTQGASKLFGEPGSMVGKTFSDKAFVSTSASRATAERFAAGSDGALVHITVPAGTKAITGSASESEVILPWRTNFTVTSDGVTTATRNGVSHEVREIWVTVTP